MMTYRTGARALLSLLLLTLICSMSGPGCLGGVEGLETEAVQMQALSLTVSGNGQLEAYEPHYVYPVADASIAVLNIRDGDYVEAGQVIASLDTGSLEKAFKEAESNYLTQSSMGDLFQALFSDLESMFGAVNASLGIVEYYRSSLMASAQEYGDEISALIPQLPPEVQGVVEEIRARLQRDYELFIAQAPSVPYIGGSGYPSSAAAADAARSELAYTVYVEAAEDLANPDIVAPISGNVFFSYGGGLVPEDMVSGAMTSEVGGFTSSMNFIAGGLEGMVEDMVFDFILPELEIGVGSFVKENSPAFIIADLDRLLLRLKVEEVDIGLVKEGQKVDVYLDALPHRVLEGRVAHVANRSSLSLSETPLFEVEVEVDAPGENLRLGYSALADIHVVDEEQAVVVPLEAVLMEPHPHVFVVEDGVAHSRDVELGMEMEDRVEILGGLDEGETIVVKGARKVKDGGRV
ncbi:MAG: efflux RND transporter periplasmic adaptor subunit [Actinobacteria bacterium]|jgi:multidrug efflux pump subunit AcrA (membrane-fusion protein)|nr:MAG: efflux RND transporter periplasmic adaptor subunit [Actinomycetota bacterium]